MDSLMAQEHVLDLQCFTPDDDVEFCASAYSGCPSGVSFVQTNDFSPL